MILLIGLSIAYLLAHPIVDQDIWSSLGTALFDLLVTSLIMITAGLIGTRILPTLDVPAGVRFVMRISMGLGIISLLILALGSFLGLSQLAAWLILFAIYFFLRKSAKLWLADFPQVSQIWRKSSLHSKIIMTLGFVVFLIALIVALAPPLKFDALVYHLTLPELYDQAAKIFYIEEIVHWGFPQLLHMLSTLSLTLGAVRVAPIALTMGALAIIGMGSHMADRLGRKAALIGLAAILSGTSLSSSLAWAYVDWPLILFAWAAIASLDYFVDKKENLLPFLGAIFIAFAFSTKYTAALLFPITLLILYFQQKRKIKSILFFSALTLLFISPWLLRNFLATGNPIYPLLFSGAAINAFRLNALQALPPQGNWLDLLFLPIRATFWGLEGGRIGNAPGYEASIGPILFIFSLFAWQGKKLLSPKKSQLLSIATTIGIGTLLFWAIAARYFGHLSRTHLYYFAFPAFSILAAFGYLSLTKILNERLVSLLALFFLAISTFSILSSAIESQAIQPLMSTAKDQTYLEKNLGLHAIVMQYLREDLPSESKVILLWEARGYYCLPSCDPDELLDHWRAGFNALGNSEALFGKWKSNGFSHILYYREAAQFIAKQQDYHLPIDIHQIEIQLSTLTVEKNFSQIYVLYQLNNE